jgi:hypothetical protein
MAHPKAFPEGHMSHLRSLKLLFAALLQICRTYGARGRVRLQVRGCFRNARLPFSAALSLAVRAEGEVGKAAALPG